MKRTVKSIFLLILALSLLCCLAGCGGGQDTEKVIIYSNADDEAVTAMKNALDANGYQGKYIIQSFGTSELGGKLLAEGNLIEADAITMSSYYIESAQARHGMFLDLGFESGASSAYPAYYTPLLAIQGTLIINTEVLAEAGLPAPAAIKDLAGAEYAGQISIVDIAGSSTAWLMIQSLIAEYGEEETAEILRGIYTNAGAHLEQSGSGPIKKVRAGEVAIGFGLRHQAVADKTDGLPIDYIDPAEGTYSLTESLAVVDKGDDTKALTMEIVECIVKHARAELLTWYPVPLYEGESVSGSNEAGDARSYTEPLTVELLEKHLELSQNCK